MSRKVNIPRFAFYVNKPKAAKLAQQFSTGCRNKGFECILVSDGAPKPGYTGIFYGVVDSTYSAFRYYKGEGRAVYLDNGWLSTREKPTFRFTWNAAQSFLYDMNPVEDLTKFHTLPPISRKPERDLALLILQTPQYFKYLRLPYTREVWERATTRLLTMKGYRVEVREKPQTKNPDADTFFDQMERAGIVVSLNSAACLKAMRWRIPSYCTLDCTLSPLAPVRLPDVGKAAPPTIHDVDDLCRRLARYEFNRKDLTSGAFIQKIMAVPADKRRGYWYAT